MAKGKGKQKPKAQEPATKEPDAALTPMEEADPERFTAFEYLVVNALFWVFCLVNLLVAKWFMGETTGLFFFFGVMALGFTAACVISYLHDRFYRDDLPETESP